MQDWYNTAGGKKFAERTVPRTADAIEALVEAIDSLNKNVAALNEILTIISSELSEQD